MFATLHKESLIWASLSSSNDWKVTKLFSVSFIQEQTNYRTGPDHKNHYSLQLSSRRYVTKITADPSIRDGVLRSWMLLYLHHRNSKLFFHSAKFDNFKDEKISDFKTVSVSQSENLLGWKLVVWWDYEQLFWGVFLCFGGAKKILNFF